MLDQARLRTLEFSARLKQAGIPLAIVTDQGSIAYLAGFWGYLSVEFGRPTFLVLRADDDPVVITPRMESEMVRAMTWVDRVVTWTDSGATRWERVLAETLG
jgi:Xaa-Pro aminopeptidase